MLKKYFKKQLKIYKILTQKKNVYYVYLLFTKILYYNCYYQYIDINMCFM